MNHDVVAATGSKRSDDSGRHEEILTVVEVARFLRVPKSTVYKLARLGQLPASKIGKHWRFHRRNIENWMRTQAASQ